MGLDLRFYGLACLLLVFFEFGVMEVTECF